MPTLKKEKTFRKEYSPVVLWLEDLQRIAEVLGSKGGSVEISTEDYRFDSVEDAAQHFGQRQQLQLNISTNKPFAQVEFARLWTKVYVSSGLDSASLYYDLDEILM